MIKYLDLVWEMKKLWNMKVTIIPTVIGAFGTVTKGLLKGQEDFEVGGQVETALLKTARILRWVLETWGDLLSSERLTANAGVKNYNNNNKKNNNNNNKKKKKKTDLLLVRYSEPFLK